MKMFLAFDIGCIECGEPSNVIGLYPTQEDAEAAITAYTDSTCWGKEGRSGQHLEEVFEITNEQQHD